MSENENPEVVESQEQIGFEEQRQQAMTSHQARQAVARRGLLRGPLHYVLLGVGILVLLVIAAVVFLQLRRSGLGKPIDYDIYPGAVLVSETKIDQNSVKSDMHTYSTNADVQTVMNFYGSKLGMLIRPDVLQKCVAGASQSTPDARFYACLGANAQESGCGIEPDKLNSARCVVDNSQDDLTQRLLITINRASGTNTTVIQVQRDWGG